MFIEQNRTLIDSQISKSLDVQNVSFTGVNSQKYQVINFTDFTTVQSSAVFSFYSKSQVTYTDVSMVEQHLLDLWTSYGKLPCLCKLCLGFL